MKRKPADVASDALGWGFLLLSRRDVTGRAKELGEWPVQELLRGPEPQAVDVSPGPGASCSHSQGLSLCGDVVAGESRSQLPAPGLVRVRAEAAGPLTTVVVLGT